MGMGSGARLLGDGCTAAVFAGFDGAAAGRSPLISLSMRTALTPLTGSPAALNRSFKMGTVKRSRVLRSSAHIICVDEARVHALRVEMGEYERKSMVEAGL